jgi:hypothetical protein
MANKPTKAEYEGFKKAVANPMTPPPIKQKLQSIIDQYSSEYEGGSEAPKAEPKSRAGRKPSTTKKYKTLPKPKMVALITATKDAVEDMKAQLKKLGYNPEEVDALNGNQAFAILEELKSKMVGKPKRTATPRATKKTATDIEKAKAEIKAKTGKTEAECEAIIEQYRALRTKAQEGKRKAEQATATNKKRVAKLEDKGDLIEGTNVKTADAVIETTAQDVAEKIEQQIEAVEEKAEKEAVAEVAKDNTKKTPTQKKQAVEAKVEKKVKEKTRVIVKKVVIDTTALLTSIATSLGKFDKDSQKEFLIKLRSDIDKLLAKYAFGGMTDGAVQMMNIQQSNLSASSVNPTMFAKGGGVDDVRKLTKAQKKEFYSKGLEYFGFKEGDLIEYEYLGDGDDEFNEDEYGREFKVKVSNEKLEVNAQVNPFSGRRLEYSTKSNWVTIEADEDDELYYDYMEIGENSVKKSERKNFDEDEFVEMGKKIVQEQFNGDTERAYDIIVRKEYVKGEGVRKPRMAKGGLTENELFAKGGGVFSKGRVVLADGKGVGGNKNKTYQLIKFDYTDGSGDEGFEIREMPSNKVMSQGKNYGEVLQYFNLYTGKFANGGGVSSRTKVEVGDEKIAVIKNRKEVKGYPVYVTTQGYLPQTIGVFETKEQAEKKAMQIRKKNKYANGGEIEEKGLYPIKNFTKVVNHFNSGDQWDLEEYPPYSGKGTIKEWMGEYPTDLEDAKAFIFESHPDWASEYEEEINDAKDNEELQDILYENDCPLFKMDNTYNSDWWGGVVQTGVLQADEDGYSGALVFVQFHRGGDVRGNYGEVQAFILNSFYEDFPLFASNLTYTIETNRGDVILDTQDFEGYTLLVVEDATGNFEEGEDVTLDELSKTFDLRGYSLYAKGGLTEHGLMPGDKIRNDFSLIYPDDKKYKNIIDVVDRNNNIHLVDLNKGERYGKMAKGGKLWIDTKKKGGLKGVKPSRKNTFRNEAVKRGISSGTLASRVIANPSRYKGINPKSAQLVKNMGVRKHGGSIGDILRNRRGE